MAAPQLGRAQLEEKDREDLAQIASALGLRGVAKADKSTLIEKILEETMAPEPKDKESTPRASASKSTGKRADSDTDSSTASRASNAAPLGADGEPLSEWEIELAEHEARRLPLMRASKASRAASAVIHAGSATTAMTATTAATAATVRIATAISATPAATSTTVADETDATRTSPWRRSRRRPAG